MKSIQTKLLDTILNSKAIALLFKITRRDEVFLEQVTYQSILKTLKLSNCW